MKLGIKSKLFFSFVIVIIIPTLLTLILLVASSYKYMKNPDMKEFQEIESIEGKIIKVIENNFSAINDYDVLSQFTSPLLEKYDVKLQLFDLSNNLLYDSNKDRLYNDDQEEYYYLSDGNIIINDKTVGKVKFYTHKNYKLVIKRFTSSQIRNFVVGIISLISLILLFTLYISKSILVPLKELNTATENIANGNLDFEIKYNKGDELGKFCNTFDIMRIKLKESLEKQLQDENSRKEMIASISHDLRTPLASIKGYVEGLQDGVAQEKEQVDCYLSVIKDKTDKLDRLIDDLFQFSQLELDKLAMDMKLMNSREVIEDILSHIELEAQNWEIKLSVNRPLPSVPIQIDPYRISQVTDNLIQNAKKYVGKNGEITVGAVIKDNYLEMYVKDNGIGISQEDLPHVFERFYRGEKSRSREYGGTGLGLSICKYIIEAHDGTIWVKSKKNKGSIFYFTIPFFS